VPDALRDRLQTSLGATYTLDRELGGGGMSRVFVAREPALGREVVVKLLHPDLMGGVNVERFKREIQLAAQLQHPHVVPVLAAGEMDGVPYLTMPYVAGRSLRERLAERPMLPIVEATDVLRDVARALAYAHGRGVVHRDIKPDNVLLAEGSATVTDFGVAKAIAVAGAGPRHGTLTSVGTSIGTPAYMAPEQAAGDPDTDHRADLYAWGAMAYEVLAGRPPFTDRSPHKLLAAHIGQAPEPITDHRPDCPPALARLVMRCLAKSPDGRPANAAELLRALAELGTPSGGGHEALPAIALATRRTLGRALALYLGSFALVAVAARGAIEAIGLPDWVFPGALIVMALGLPVVLFTAFVHHQSRVARTVATRTPGGTLAHASTMSRVAVRVSPHVSWRRTTLGGAAAVALFTVAVVTFMAMRALGIGPAGSLIAKGALGNRDQVVVADFGAPAADSTLGSVVGDAVRVGLGESRAVRVMPVNQVAAALGRMQRPPGSRLDRALARELAQREGAKAVVDGEVTPLGAGYIVTVRLRDAASDDELASFRESADAPSELIPAIDRATRALRGMIGESLKAVRASAPLAQVTTASLPALRKYSEGYRAHLLADFATAVPAYEEAIRLDSSFAFAYRQLGFAYSTQGTRPERVDSLRRRAFELRERLPELERALVEATYFHAESPAADRRRAIAANQRVLELDPTHPSPMNALGLIYVERRELARAESLFARARELHPDIAFIWTNLAYTQLAQGRVDESMRTIEEFRRRFPTVRSREWVGAPAWTRQFGIDSLDAICTRAFRTPSEQERRIGARCLEAVALTRGRLREASRRTAERGALERSAGNPWFVQEALDSAYLDIWFRERPAEGVRRLDAYVAGTPLREAPRQVQLYFRVASLYAWAGRPDRARAVLARYAAEVRDTARARLESHLRRRAEGEVAIAERRFDDGIRLLQQSDTLYDGAPAPCPACALAALARAYDLAGRTDASIATFERYLSDGTFRALEPDPQYLAGTHKRLAELYDAKGDRTRAAAHFAAFVDLWKGADPELQPKVASARRRLAALTAGERP
jgi:tetratricopeptide (TPR) repeat protein